MEVAKKIYEELVKRNEGEMILISRLNYIYSVVDPESIKDEALPDFELIEDFNTLANLENDYLTYVQKEGKKENKEIKKEKKTQKKKKKRKIRWPKNFDPEKPGPRPDEERWVPKM